MIIFSDNFITSVDLEGKDTSIPEDIEGKDSSVPDDLEGKDTSILEDIEGKDSSTSEQLSATGETQQSVAPTIVNDIVVPDNSYSKYCFFFLMLLFALFVGRSFRKGV